jgi:hypothetical protein
MSLNKHTIKKGEWKKISNAGENGKAWMKDTIDGTAIIVIAHTDTTQTGGSPVGDNIPLGSALDLDIEIGYTLPQNGDPFYSAELTADNASDIYYATLKDEGSDCEIIADFI